jgi:putative transposase
MRKKRFSVEQIVAVLKQAELGLPVADLIRQLGISGRLSGRVSEPALVLAHVIT